MNQWQIGEIMVTRIVEMQVTGGTKFILPTATPERIKPMSWLQPHFADADGNLIMSVHALVIETPSKKIIVDTCIGNDKKRNIPSWNQLKLPFLQDLAKAGYDRHDIDIVLCTHLHVDHVGWNTMLENGEWVPTFPNARYLFSEAEFNYWMNVEGDSREELEYANIMADSVRPIEEAGLTDLVSFHHKLCEGVYLSPSLGHTPGHVSVNIESGGEKAIITGDAFHHPCQIAMPEWASSADFDSEMSTETRQDMLAQLSDSKTLVIGTHFATPTAGHVRHNGEEHWFDVSDQEP